MQGSYWTKALTARISRRRALIGGGTAAGAAAFLVACGSDSTPTPTGGGPATGGATGSSPTGATGATGPAATQAPSLIAQPVDETSQAKRGGILLDRNTTDPPHLDVHAPVAPLNFSSRHVYNTLLMQKTVKLADFDAGDVGPNLAESWEQSPDGMEIALRVRPGVKFHNVAPVNGRALDIDDVVFTWDRFAEKGVLRGLYANKVNPNAPILSAEARDERTIVFKLAEPVVYALNFFASYGSFSGNINVIPKESDDTLDLRTQMVGTGPYYLDNYSPSVSITLKRNEDFWDKNANNFDQINYPIMPEYAQLVAQLKAGNVHVSHYPDIRGEDIFQVKQDQPNLQLYESIFASNIWLRSFGWLPEGQSPFLDERVRQAVSMSWDRDAWIDAIYNTDGFEKQGLPVTQRWNSHLGAEDWWVTGDWLDPKSSEFGPNAKYFQHNIAEAKALMAAAGHGSGLDVISNYVTGGQIGTPAWTESLDGMVQEIGIKISVNDINYQTDYIPNFRDASGQYEGWTIATVAGTIPSRLSPVSALAAEYWPKSGPQFRGFSTTGANDKAGDPELTGMIEKARLERNSETRQALVHDIQRYLGKAMWGLLMPGGATGFSVAWPAVRNYHTWSGIAQARHYGLWLDQTKPPFA